MIKFTQKVKNKWIKAMASGEYTQGKGMLKYTDGDGEVCHCALGVLGELYPKLMESNIGSYQGFNDLLTSDTTTAIWKKNDKRGTQGNRDFKNIIPFIKEIPVTD